MLINNYDKNNDNQITNNDDDDNNNNDNFIININNNKNNKICSESHHKYYHNKYDFNDCCNDSLELFVDLMLSENEYILSGFRLETKNSYIECTKSMFTLHNDTLNIWTHLVGAIIYLVLLFKSINIINYNNNNNINNSTNDFQSYINNNLNSDEKQTLNFIDLPSNFNFLFFLFSCFLCFTSSTIYHTYRSHSIPVFRKTLMLDVSSIGFLILSSVCLIIDSELSCWPSFKKVYLSLFLILIIIALLLLPKIMREKRYGFRTLIFSILALQGIVSHLLRIYMQGYFDQDFYVLKCLVFAYLFIGLGLAIRRLKVPEKYSPGKFDIWFSSHQIFHVLVVIGTIQIYNAFQRNYLNPNHNVDYVKHCLGFY
ncbi:hypothetical protein DICPUDRAFT_46764 [Dictyostelium purpureum]|uniref:Uncharacterized protein n=1 Tax=Dictyostelium purpureum TaxID=5786 RepID=F0ZG63_DICPU|nr:uncharacterized protein DICPUDRAFT_46764 [Dictyostelium purpureum]EGC37047.1 hypothetical protein DICPUDRAFT_46764 [Dictyostelium purpureum]|eukprot:XP_003286404.1 hypothetical protein DICPUDRAFT_46764 [Dictyostelium purpureum]